MLIPLMDDIHHWALCRSDPLEIVHRLHPQDAERLLDAVALLNGFNQNRLLIEFVRANHAELITEFERVSLEHSEWLTEVILNCTRLLLNFLASTRLFLDQTEFYLKRSYGLNSSHVLAFKEVTATAYDSSFEYRFLYKLRNYVQHCGAPFGKVQSVVVEGSTEPFGAKFRTTLLLDPEYLLQQYDGWGVVAADLTTREEPIGVRECVDVYVAHLERIEVVAIVQDLDAVEDASEFVCGVLSAFGSSPNKISLINVAAAARSVESSLGEPAPITFTLLPVEVANMVRGLRERIRSDYPDLLP